MKKIILFLYFIVYASATISLDALQGLMIDKKYDVKGIFYKYDFANVEPAWDFVYVSNDVYYQLKGSQSLSNNVFGWKIIDKVVLPNPSFYFIYLSDIDEDNQTKYDWVALSKVNSTTNKLVGSTSSGYFSWSDNLSKLSFSFSEVDKKVTFHKAINGGTSIDDQNLPKFPDLPDRLTDTGNTDASDTNNKNTGSDDNSNIIDTNNSNTDDTKDNNSSGDANNNKGCTQFSGSENSSCVKYYEEVKKYPQIPECNGNISCIQYYTNEDIDLESCNKFVISENTPQVGECKKWQP